MQQLDLVIADHVHCERKAAQSALSLMRAYPERVTLTMAVAQLAHEETRHVVQVAGLLHKRGGKPIHDHGDAYAAALGQHVRKRDPQRLLDRLLVFAVIEGRSAERLQLIADALPEQDVEAKRLYGALAKAEVRHCETFMQLASEVDDDWKSRAITLCALEARALQTLPLQPRIH